MKVHPGQIRGLLLGEQRSGKSTRERVWTDKITNWTYRGVDVVRCILVFDRNHEDDIWNGAGPVVSTVSEFWSACDEASVSSGAAELHLLPRVVVRAGMEPQNYREFLRLAIDQGDFLVVFCEGSDWAPSQRAAWPVVEIGRGITLDTIFRAGRHIPDSEGVPRHIHWMLDTQEAIGLSPLIRNQANLVSTGALEGANNLRWVRDNFGRDGYELAKKAQALGEHQWLLLRNKMRARVPKFPLKID
jgi:hypothetical protein